MRSRRSMRALLLCAALAFAGVAVAVDTTPPLADPLLQQRYYELTHELRCMQCQNEALADSSAGLAADLRVQVHELLLAGQSDDQIRDHMVARYGEFILFRPRMSWRNSWLWAAPTLLMLVGVIIGWRVMRARSRLVASEEADSNGESLEL
jgi:cytochrome c-type biogenesis protein CcmH